MIKGFFYWFWQLFTAIVTFQWKHLKYHWTNFWWYLWYGFTYSDIMDMDRYLIERIGNMAEKFEQSIPYFPDGLDGEDFKCKIGELQVICRILLSSDFDEQPAEKQEIIRRRFFTLFEKLLFKLWF